MATTTLPQAQPYRRAAIYDWITTVDHKKIGIMYVVSSFMFFLVGGLLALVIRSELAAPGLQFVTAEQYNSVFGLHAINMIFLFVMPMMTGLGNYIVPLQVGRRGHGIPARQRPVVLGVPGRRARSSRARSCSAGHPPAGPCTHRCPRRPQRPA